MIRARSVNSVALKCKGCCDVLLNDVEVKGNDIGDDSSF